MRFSWANPIEQCSAAEQTVFDRIVVQQRKSNAMHPFGNIRWFVVTGLVLAAGCSRAPQISPNNRRLIESLRTAVSARNPDWLEANIQKIEVEHGQQALSDEEYAEFQSIIALARADDWKAAQTELTRLAKAQQSAPDDPQHADGPKPKSHKR